MYVAIDVGGTKTFVATYDSEGNRLSIEKVLTNRNYEAFIAEISQKVNALEGDLDVVAVAFPGHVEDDNGIVEGAGNLDWHDIDVHGDFSAKIDAPIILDNDANMGALGEAVLGAGMGKRKVMYITLSTGIGTGAVVDGHVAPVLRESEGGAMVFMHEGKLTKWEYFASGKAFYEKYQIMGKDCDDPVVWKEYAETLIQGFWAINCLVQPDVFVIGGSMGEHFKKYEQFLVEGLEQAGHSSVVDMPPITQADDPTNAVINGCFVAAKNYAEAH